MSSDRWQRVESLLSSRKAQVCLLSFLVIIFTIVRWQQRLEPWNSDDMELFGFFADAASGHHWIFGSSMANGDPVPHAAFRVGLLPATVLAIKVLGATATAYYIVPLAFSVLGFGILYWVNVTSFGALAALIFALIHVVWPFELQHSSVLLTDLPAAALSLLSLCLLDVSARHEQRRRVACAVLGGLAGWGTYLMRNNGLVLLAPAYLLFALQRTTRWQTAWAAIVVAFGVLGQQAFLVYRGFGWGSDWSSVRVDFAEYADFLPIYTWSNFLARQFSFQVSTFGPGLNGILAALLVAGSLILHLALLRFERHQLLRAIAAYGLFAWLVFSFSIYERVPGGVRAMSPVNFRFIQPFTYSSLVAWAWAWCALRKVLTRPLLSAMLPLVLFVFSCVASVFSLPSTYRHSGTHRLAAVVRAQQSRATEPLRILGTQWSLQVPRLFCCAAAPQRVDWDTLSIGAIATQLEAGSSAFVLRDVPRELQLARYFAPKERVGYRSEMAQVEARLWHDYTLIYVDAKYALFAPRGGSDPATPDILRNEMTVPASWPNGGAPLLGAPGCEVFRDDETNVTTLPPGRRPSSCEYAALADGLVIPAGDASSASNGDSGFVLRVTAEYEPPMALSVEVSEYGDQGVQRQPRISLSPGTSYLPVRLHAGTHSVVPVYRAATRAGQEAQPIRLLPAQWRPHQFPRDN